jgi:hypothetical protein
MGTYKEWKLIDCQPTDDCEAATCVVADPRGRRYRFDIEYVPPDDDDAFQEWLRSYIPTFIAECIELAVEDGDLELITEEVTNG